MADGHTDEDEAALSAYRAAKVRLAYDGALKEATFLLEHFLAEPPPGAATTTGKGPL